MSCADASAVPVEALALTSPSLETSSSGVDDAPAISSTVTAIAAAPDNVTVTVPFVPIGAVSAANQISSSACWPSFSWVAEVQVFPDESTTEVTVSNSWRSRFLMVATSRSPPVVGEPGDTESDPVSVVLAPPKDWTTPRLTGAVARCRLGSVAKTTPPMSVSNPMATRTTSPRRGRSARARRRR